MYTTTLLLHSYLLHVVLFFGVWVLVSSFRASQSGRSWSDADERTHKIFLAALDMQMLLGLALYLFLSPITRVALSDLGASMKDPTLRFFGVEHIFAMLLGVIAAHVGRVRGKKREGVSRQRVTFAMQCLWLVLTLSGIPWPGLDIGRPLLR